MEVLRVLTRILIGSMLFLSYRKLLQKPKLLVVCIKKRSFEYLAAISPQNPPLTE